MASSLTKATPTRARNAGGGEAPSNAASVAANAGVDSPPGRVDAGAAAAPPAPKRMRLPLNTIDDVKAELARIYREGKAGTRDVADVSKLGNLLNLLGRLIVDHELQARIEALEERSNPRRTT